MKNTGVTLIIGQDQSAKTALLNRFITNMGHEKVHVFVEEDEGIPIELFHVDVEATVSAFTLGSDILSNHNVEFSALMDLALEALRPSQFLVELKEPGSLPRCLLELTRAEVVNVRIVAVLRPEELGPEVVSAEWFGALARIADVLWCEEADDTLETQLRRTWGEKLATSEKDFLWFPLLKGWQNPARLEIGDFNPPSPQQIIEFSAWGSFVLEDLSSLLSSKVARFDQVKGVVFATSRETPGEEPQCYALTGRDGDFSLALVSHSAHEKAILGEEEFLGLLENGSPEEGGDRLSSAGLSSICFRSAAMSDMDREFELARALEAIWHFALPWGDCHARGADNIAEVLNTDPDDLDLDQAVVDGYCGLAAATASARLAYHERLGLILRETEDLYLALTHSRFATAIEETPGRLEEMARCCNNLDNYPYAVQLLTKALTIEPQNKSVLLNMLRLHLVYGEPEKGIARLDEAFDLDPDEWETVLLASHLYFETDRYEELLDLYEAHRAACDASEDFLLTLCSAHLDRGASSQALPILHRLHDDDPENFGILYLMGYANLIEGDMSKAVAFLEEALERGNDISWVYLALGLAREYLGEKQKAHELFEEAAEVAAAEFEDDPGYQPFIESAILTCIAIKQVERAQTLIEVSGRDMVFSHEFNNFVKLLSCFALPKGLSTT